jgi:hypothetical protein
LNIGWTIGEECLFQTPQKRSGKAKSEEMCKAVTEACVLALSQTSLSLIKRTLYERGQSEEFVKFEIVLRGNFLIKKSWLSQHRKQQSLLDEKQRQKLQD